MNKRHAAYCRYRIAIVENTIRDLQKELDNVSGAFKEKGLRADIKLLYADRKRMNDMLHWLGPQR